MFSHDIKLIYYSCLPIALQADVPTGSIWVDWWKHLVAIGGGDVLTRAHSGDLVWVLVFFAQWATQVTKHPQSQATSIEDAKASIIDLVGYLTSSLQKRKASVLDD